MFLPKNIRFSLILLLFFLVGGFGFQGALAAEKKPLSYGTTSSTSGSFAYFVTAAKAMNDGIPEVSINVRSTGGVVHNVRLLEKDDVDIGAIDTKVAWEAINGKGGFKDKPFMNLRLLYVHQTNKMQIVVSEKSGVKDVYGLEGKLFCPGPLGSSTESMCLDIFRILGVHPKIRPASLADGVEQITSQMIDGIGKLGAPPDATVMSIMAEAKIRLISFSNEDIMKIVKGTIGLRPGIIPATAYPKLGEIKTVENEWGDMVRKEFPEDLAYKIVKVLWERRAEIKKVFPNFLADRFPEVSLGVNTVYMHPGAIKFYRELGLTIPKILIPPEMEGK